MVCSAYWYSEIHGIHVLDGQNTVYGFIEHTGVLKYTVYVLLTGGVRYTFY